MKRSIAAFMTLSLMLCLMLGTHAVTTVSAATTAGYADFSYHYSGVTAPTGEKPQSKLWYNDGRWWGDMFHVASHTYHIFWLNQATQQWVDTGTVLDTRAATKADCLWDDASGKLYVASGGTGSDGKLFRYSYNSTTKTYSPDTGFPVTIRVGGAETLVIDKDTTGKLWITYTKGSKVYVNRSLTSDASWGTGFIVPVSGVNVSSDDISSLVAFDGKIGVLWSNQTDATFYFAVHVDGAPDTTWTGGIAYRNPNIADDHINLKSLQADSAGNVFAAVKTSINGSSTTTPQIMVLAHRPNGTWDHATFSSGAENQTRPILLIDTDHRLLYVFASDESGGAVYYKQSGLDNLQFVSGKGTPFIMNASYPKINNATSTKQNVNSTTGLVVLAGDDSVGWYLHNTLPLDGSTPPPPPTATPTPLPTATPVPTGNLLKNPGFELDTNNDGRPDNWGSNTNTSRSSAVVHSGSYAMQHTSTGNVGYNVSQVVSNLSAGTGYSFGSWVNIPATSDAFTFKLQVRWRDASNATISTSVVATYSAATSGWVATSASLVAPAGTTNAQVQMVVSSLNATIYADDLDFHVTSP